MSRSSAVATDVLPVIVRMIDEFCRDHLNEEYALICRKLAEELARKRPSPLLSGKPNAWACGIVRTIGLHNFLGDKTQTPYMKIGDISREGGGPMADEHVSHQNGLDVDVYYPRRDGTLRAPTAPGEIDHRRAQDLLRHFVAAGAQMVFVGYSTGLRGPAGAVIPYANHENHMHVRFPPPST